LEGKQTNMTDKVSPHRRWLGLAQAQPDLFQLLGVERSERQPEVFRAAAEARLGLLKSFRDAEGLSERKALAEEIKLAFATLSNPSKREEYEQKFGPQASPPANSTTPPPLAIPLAVPIALPNPTTSTPPLAPNPMVQAQTEPKDPLAAVAALESKQRRRKPSKSRAWVLTTLGLFLFLGGPLLIIGIIWFNSQDRLIAQQSVEKKRPSSEQPLVNKPSLAGPFAGLTPQPREEDRSTSPEEPASNDDSAVPVPSGSPEQPDSAERPDMSRPPETSDFADFASPSIRELNRVIWNDLRYRDSETAKKRLQLAKGVLTSASEQAQLTALEEVVGHLDRYWKQLVQSSARMRTGEIKWGDESAGFIESTDQYVLVKLKGIGLKVLWEYVRPDIAVQLAEQGPIADIPAWRLAKASALMLDTQTAREQEPLIRQWLDESAADGHEIANLEWVLSQRVARSPGVLKMPAPSGELLESAKRSLREVLPEKNIAANNVAGRKAVIDQLLAEAARQADPAVKFVALERARDHAIRLVDIPLCRELLESLATAFEIDVESKMLDSVSEMAAFVQTEVQAERVCEAILISSGVSLTELTKGAVEPKVLRTAEELARKQGLKQMLDRIHYLTGRD
jgi:hypothetical protein